MRTSTKAVVVGLALVVVATLSYRPFATLDRHYRCEGKKEYTKGGVVSASPNAVLGLRIRRYSNIGDSPYYVNYRLIGDVQNPKPWINAIIIQKSDKNSFISVDDDDITMIEKWQDKSSNIGEVFLFDYITGIVSYVRRFDRNETILTFGGKCEQIDA